MEINNRIEIIEVGPRDGFQSIKEFISTEEKKKIIEGIIESGVKKDTAYIFCLSKTYTTDARC